MNKDTTLDEAIELLKQAARKLYYIGLLETIGCAEVIDAILGERLIPLTDKKEEASE